MLDKYRKCIKRKYEYVFSLFRECSILTRRRWHSALIALESGLGSLQSKWSHRDEKVFEERAYLFATPDTSRDCFKKFYFEKWYLRVVEDLCKRSGQYLRDHIDASSRDRENHLSGHYCGEILGKIFDDYVRVRFVIRDLEVQKREWESWYLNIRL